MTCILQDYRKDKCGNCTKLCTHRVALHGLNGDGGRTLNANIPKDYRYVTINNSPVRESQAKIYVLLDRYVQTFKRKDGDIKSLYLWSESPGTGKTTTATALLNAYISTEYLTALSEGRQPPRSEAYFLDVNEFQTKYNLATMTNDEDGIKRIRDEIKRTQDARFAVLDDIGVRSSSEAFRAYVHAIINHRTTNGLPTIYTSNLKLDGMREVFDDRLYDRMRDQCAEIFFSGESKRGRR